MAPSALTGEALVILKRLIDLTDALARSADDVDLSEFEALLEERGQVIADLTALELGLDDSESVEFARELLLADEQLIRMVKSELSGLDKALRDVRRGRAAIRGYKPYRVAPPIYCDRSA